ncbi:NCS2 family permease [Corynebacterium sp.]|jgi:AGZA family xanthine/uracil permease-like MFS transporter|uniref:NCS2 family permease n=1 Tax=Corynebacterium sp. TaxID=1720 RepID=UPI0025BF3475|nr:NCS2 family permease [Corynebacterium sp.]
MATTTDPDGSTEVKEGSFLDRFFHITERGSTIGTEVRGGVVTFFAMAYIILLNPLIIGTVADHTGAELGVSAVAAVTAFAAGVMTIAFGVFARYPFGIAAGLGINTLVAVTFVSTEGLTWPEAMGLVVIDGIIIVILAVSGFREAVFNAIPASLKSAITVGIGLFIAFVGVVDSGFVTRNTDDMNTTVPVSFGIGGSITTWSGVVFVVGLVTCGILAARKVRGGLFIGIVTTTIFAVIVQAIAGDDNPESTGWHMATPDVPDSFGGMPDLGLLGEFDLFGAFTRIGFLSACLLIFTLVLSNFFDAMGTMTGLGKQAGLVNEKGVLPNMRTALIVEGAGAVVGGGASASSNTVFVDSAAGIGDGARTGLANVVTGVIFLAAMFLTPLYEVVPIEAAAPVLVIVGAMMMAQIKDIDFGDLAVGLPAFLTIVMMPFSYSIANGIGIGFVAYVVLQLGTGNWRRIHPLMYLVAILFAVYFGIDPIKDAIG